MTPSANHPVKSEHQRIRPGRLPPVPTSSTGCYGKLGREKEAKAELEEFLEPRPYYTLRHYAQGEFYKNPEDLDYVLDGLRKAGLPE